MFKKLPTVAFITGMALTVAIAAPVCDAMAKDSGGGHGGGAASVRHGGGPASASHGDGSHSLSAGERGSRDGRSFGGRDGDDSRSFGGRDGGDRGDLGGHGNSGGGRAGDAIGTALGIAHELGIPGF